jgi:hypothetical protein
MKSGWVCHDWFAGAYGTGNAVIETGAGSSGGARASPLAAILVLGAAFRFCSANWDEDTYCIHPDERHTTVVVTAIQRPERLIECLDTSHSSLNPRTNKMVYSYGTLPLFLP